MVQIFFLQNPIAPLLLNSPHQTVQSHWATFLAMNVSNIGAHMIVELASLTMKCWDPKLCLKNDQPGMMEFTCAVEEMWNSKCLPTVIDMNLNGRRSTARANLK
ncbi:hypothetical protein CMV_002465, partial [Castanea mollissima]